jgi:hypothetical protein
MTAGTGDHIHDCMADFLGEFSQAGAGDGFEIGRGVDGFKKAQTL